MDNSYQNIVSDVVSYINENFVAEKPQDIFNPGCPPREILKEDGTIDETKADRYAPITTTLAFLNSLMGKNTMLKGGSGTSKTQLNKVIASMLYQIPIEFFDLERISGVPKATKDDIYGTYDIQKLNTGEPGEYLFLSFYAPVVIIDEVNRFTSFEQNIIREGVSCNIWTVGGKHFEIPDQIVMSARNPDDYDGVSLLNENIADNYSIQLPPAKYNIVSHEKVIVQSEGKMNELLGNKELVNLIKAEYDGHKEDCSYMQKFILDKTEDMRKVLKKRGVPFIHNGEIKKVREAISSQKFGAESKLLQDILQTEMDYSRKYGENRSEDPRSDDDHDLAYISTDVKEALKGRFVKDWNDLAKAISWYMKEPEVSIDSLKTAFIYTAAHRIKPELGFQQEIYVKRSKDNMPASFEPMAVEYECARTIFEKAYKHYAEWKDNDKNTMSHLRKAIRTLTGDEKGSTKDVVKALKMVDHPVGLAALDALAEEQLKKRKNSK
jgi:hypothetical protein